MEEYKSPETADNPAELERFYMDIFKWPVLTWNDQQQHWEIRQSYYESAVRTIEVNQADGNTLLDKDQEVYVGTLEVNSIKVCAEKITEKREGGAGKYFIDDQAVRTPDGHQIIFFKDFKNNIFGLTELSDK